MEIRLGERVSLKPNEAESLLDDACASVARPSGNSYRAKAVPGNPAACWHSSCRVLRISRTGACCWRTTPGTCGKRTPIPL